MKVVFYTIASDLFKDYARMCENSFKKFHPDIPFLVFPKTGDTTYQFAEEGLKLSEEYELVIRIDADSIICGNLDYVWEYQYDLAGVLDLYHPNSDDGVIKFLDKDYLNVGLVASRSQTFWREWCWRNFEYANQYPLKDNDVFNLIFHFGKYKTCTLEKMDMSVYGCSINDKWDKFEIINDKIMCEGRQVRIMHRAGGSNETSLGLKEKSYREVGFSEEVCKQFDYLTS